MIKAICFDLDGVYFTDQGKKSFHEALVNLTGSEERVSHILYKSPEMLDYVTGKLSETSFWQFVREYLNLSLSNGEFRKLWVKDYAIDLEVKRAVQAARNTGYLTCICSNNNPGRIEALEEKFGFLGDFDIKVFSYEVGFTKPSREIFQALVDKSAARPEEIVYSDDNPERIKGAADLGINVFVYESFQQFLKELAGLGVTLV